MIHLWLDDVRSPPEGWTHCRTIDEAKEHLKAGKVYLASLDHDLGEDERGCLLPSGYDLVKWMAENNCWPLKKPYVHSANPVGAQNMNEMIDRYFPGT
jgi:hypothetical protein